ncbi:MAG: hypothetical protein HQL10_03215 [Nitrospirae bacterium]|nr:hypothetical protein [Nitrospirota bacterium]
MIPDAFRYFGEFIGVIACGFVLIHMYNEGIKYLLYVLVTVIIDSAISYAVQIKQLFSLPLFSQGIMVFSQIYVLYYILTKYKKESRIWILGTFIVGAVIHNIGIMFKK